MPPRQDLNTYQRHLETTEMNALLLPSGTIALAALQFFVITMQLLNSARRAAEDPILHRSQAITTTTTTIPLQLILCAAFGMLGMALHYLFGKDVLMGRLIPPPSLTFTPNQNTQARLKSFHDALCRETSKDLVGAIAFIAGLICELLLISSQLIEKHNIILGLAFLLMMGNRLLKLDGLFAREDQNKVLSVERLIRNSQSNVQNENPLSHDNSNRNLNRNNF